MLSADVFRIVKRVLRREHEPSTRTQNFVMKDGKWCRQGADGKVASSEARDRRRGERRVNERRRLAELELLQGGGGRVSAPPMMRKAALRARKKK